MRWIKKTRLFYLSLLLSCSIFLHVASNTSGKRNSPFPITISLNGVDNVGKTTQMQLLPLDSQVDQRTSIHHYTLFLKNMMDEKTFDNWWWTSDDEDFVTAIFDALKKRCKGISTNAKAVVFDRGTYMFDAVCVARIAQKTKYHWNKLRRNT